MQVPIHTISPVYIIMKKDLFGFDNQGINYEKFRPKYPHRLLQLPITKLKNRNRYLDIAVGTGQILFQIYSSFQYSKGIDISPKMLSVCQSRLQELAPEIKQKQCKVEFEKIDFLSEQFNTNQDQFDYITIGQALHWLPVAEALKKMKYMINEDGEIAVYGYILKDIRCAQLQSTIKCRQAFYQFYDRRVKEYFQFDRNQLHLRYTQQQKYPFEEIFPNVQRINEQVSIKMQGPHFLSYLQTFSGYNTYLQHKKDDPIKIMKQAIPADEEFQAVFDYFLIRCRN